MQDLQWHELLKAYFGKSLTDRQAMVWYSEILNGTKYAQPVHTNNAEMCEAIRWVNTHRHELIPEEGWKMRISQFRQWIYAYRNATEDSLFGINECTCNDGWLEYRRPDGSTCEIPCGCKKGRSVQRRCYPDAEPNTFKARQETAWKQKIARRAGLKKMYNEAIKHETWEGQRLALRKTAHEIGMPELVGYLPPNLDNEPGYKGDIDDFEYMPF